MQIIIPTYNDLVFLLPALCHYHNKYFGVEQKIHILHYSEILPDTSKLTNNFILHNLGPQPKERVWSNNSLINFFESDLVEDYFLLSMGDMILNQKVDISQFDEICEYVREKEIDKLDLFDHVLIFGAEKIGYLNNLEILKPNLNSKWKMSFYPSIFKKSFFNKFINKFYNKNIWQVEEESSNYLINKEVNIVGFNEKIYNVIGISNSLDKTSMLNELVNISEETGLKLFYNYYLNFLKTRFDNKIENFDILVQKENEWENLIKFLLRQKIKFNNILEIGTNNCGSFYGLISLSEENANLFSIDKENGNFITKENKIHFINKIKKSEQIINIINGDSTDKNTIYELEKKLEGDKLDLIFIDGNHNLSYCKSDFYNYKKYAKDNSLIIFHDIAFKHNESHVNYLWNKIKTKYKYEEFIEEKDGLGIGIIEYHEEEDENPLIYDCFIFFNELEILYIRLKEMYDMVDRFVLIESRKTFKGIGKKLYYNENKDLFKEFNNKIIHIIIDDLPFPISKEDWGPEIFQRNKILEILNNECKNEDIIMISDVDEIPGRHFILSGFIDSEPKVCKHYFHEQFLNLFNKVKKFTLGTAICKYEYLINNFNSIQEIRNERFNFKQVEGGYHFTFMGGKEKIIEKIKSYTHYQLDSKEWISSLINNMNDGKIEKDINFIITDPKSLNLAHIEHIIDKYPDLFINNKKTQLNDFNKINYNMDMFDDFCICVCNGPNNDSIIQNFLYKICNSNLKILKRINIIIYCDGNIDSGNMYDDSDIVKICEIINNKYDFKLICMKSKGTQGHDYLVDNFLNKDLDLVQKKINKKINWVLLLDSDLEITDDFWIYSIINQIKNDKTISCAAYIAKPYFNHDKNFYCTATVQPTVMFLNVNDFKEMNSSMFRLKEYNFKKNQLTKNDSYIFCDTCTFYFYDLLKNNKKILDIGEINNIYGIYHFGGGNFVENESKNFFIDLINWKNIKKKKSPYPKEIELEITSRCNLRCVMCSQSWTNDDKKEDLPNYILDKIKEPLSLAKNVSLHGIGEPLLSNNIWDIVDNINLNCYVSFHSNMLILSEKDAEKIVEGKIKLIDISLDAATEETYLKIRGGSFNKVLKNIQTIVRKKEEIGSIYPQLRMNMTLMKENINEVCDFVLLAKKVGINTVHFWRMNEDWYPPKVENKNFIFIYNDQTLSNYKNLFNENISKARKLAIQNNIEFILDSNLFEDTI